MNRSSINKLVIQESNNISKNNRIINEQSLNGKTIINVDIQPEYQSYITFNMLNWVKFINKSNKNNNIIFLYNGADTMGMISEGEYINWLYELGISEDVIDKATFYDKGYAFFRYCMDNSISEKNIADLVRYMMEKDINDSRDIDSDMWNDYMQTTGHDQQDVRDLLENAGDMVSIPDLMEFIKNYNNIVLTGGGINECLKEVEIALLALNKPYNTHSEFTY